MVDLVSISCFCTVFKGFPLIFLVTTETSLLRLLRKSKENLWKRVKFEKLEEKPKIKKGTKWKHIYYGPKRLARHP